MVKIRPLLMKNRVMHYAWGRKDNEAFIAELLDIKAEAGRPYAELWMGAHPKASSMVHFENTEMTLEQLIQKHPQEMLGKHVAKRFGNRLPFLFKVLSIGEPLSIQAHPNKSQAEQMHKEDPVNYPDDNHKPEIAIALNGLSALMGFRPVNEMDELFKKHPTLEQLIDTQKPAFDILFDNAGKDENSGFRMVFSDMMAHAWGNISLFQKVIDDILERMKAGIDPPGKRERLFIDCYEHYSYDIGLLSVLMLNLIELKPGEGVFIDAGVPHAYLEGEIIECMANSDNVVRAGLTPKFKDVKRLTEILTYESGHVHKLSTIEESNQVHYPTAAKEFKLSRWETIYPGERIEWQSNGPQIVLMTEGQAEVSYTLADVEHTIDVRKGQSLFIPAVTGKITARSKGKTTAFRACIPD